MKMILKIGEHVWILQYINACIVKCYFLKENIYVSNMKKIIIANNY
jgi:hypothetical protein